MLKIELPGRKQAGVTEEAVYPLCLPLEGADGRRRMYFCFGKVVIFKSAIRRCSSTSLTSSQ